MRWFHLLLLPLCHAQQDAQTASVPLFLNYMQTFGGVHTSSPVQVQTTTELVALLVNELGSSFQAPFTLHDLAKDPHATSPNPQHDGVEQIHLSLTSNPREMRVVFASTSTSTTTSQNATATALLSDGRNFTATPYTYHVPSRWWQPKGWLGQLYSVVFDQLEYNLTYSYALSLNVDDVAVGRVGLIKPPPPTTTNTFQMLDPSDTSQTVSFATYGDMGTVMPLGFKVFDKVKEEHLRDPFDFILHQGDISYAGVDTSIKILNISKDDEWEYIWDLFGRQIEPVAANIPYMTSTGNHEAWYNFTSFRARYPMPYPEQKEDEADAFWFAFDAGPVHVVSASSEHSYEVGSAQYIWLAAELQKSKKMKEKNGTWIVFAIHRPLYSSDLDGFSQHIPGSHMVAVLEPLLLNARVDLTLTGHQHGYERIHPNVNGTVTERTNAQSEYVSPNGPVHLMVGSAGAFQNEKWFEPQPAWSAKRFSYGPHVGRGVGSRPLMDSYGFVRVDVHGIKHMNISFISIKNESRCNDTFSIVR